MSRRCPRCGAEGLRDNAKFCDTCGATITVSFQEDETVSLPAATTVIDQGSTRYIPEAETPDEDSPAAAGRAEQQTIADEGATRFVPEAEDAGGEGSTRYIPEAGTLIDEDALRFAPESDPAADDGLTRSIAEITGEHHPATTALLETEVAGDAAGQAGPPDHAAAKSTGSKQEILKSGQILQHRYRLDQMLGKGGFGAAYLALDLKLKRRCVVKQMLTRGRSPREVAVDRVNFDREVNLLAELNTPGHPNIPEIYDYFSDDNGNYLIMKYIEGRNLQFVLDHDEGKIPWREAIRYAVDVCDALNYMHTHRTEPIMHRDVKPANILLGDDGRVWLVDFGLAKADPVETSNDDHRATRASGSLGYTPLEQWLGEAVPESDVYALGATLHHLVTGVDPLEAYEDEFNIKKIQDLHGQLPPIRQIDRKFPGDLEKIISQATAAEMDKRSTALQFKQQLEVLVSSGQEAVLFTFKNGKSAKTVGQLVDLCEQNREEAETYLYNGDFERWFLLINRNDLAEAATQAVEQSKDRRDGLERFLKLIMPNLFVRRLKRAGWHVVRGSIQFTLSAIIVTAVLAIGLSYIGGFIIQQSITSLNWDFSKLKPDSENYYTEPFLSQKFSEEAGTYFDNDQVEVQIKAPDQLEVNTTWKGIPLKTLFTVRLARNKQPRFYVAEINNLPLSIVGDNLSGGINRGVNTVFQRGPVDLVRLVILDNLVVFNIEPSTDPQRPTFVTATPVPGPTPTPIPIPTPTAVPVTMVIVFNELGNDVSLEIENRSWSIPANDTQVIELPPGTYTYTLRYEPQHQIAAQGTKTWNQNSAYRLSINQLQEK